MASRRSKKAAMKHKAEKMTKEANRRLESLRAQGYGKLSVIDIALADQRKNTKIDSKKFIVGENTEKTIERMNKFLESKWTTEAGRNEILEKRVKSFTKRYQSKDSNIKARGLTRKKTLQLFDIFETDVYHKAKEKGLDSEQMIDMIRGKKRKDLTGVMEKALTAFVESDAPAEDAVMFLENYLEEN